MSRNSEYFKKWYNANRQTQYERVRARKLRLFQYVQQRKAELEHRCLDCGRTFHPCVLEFDHVRGNKRCNISKIHTLGSIKLIDIELSKCELVCANCHRVRECARRGFRCSVAECHTTGTESSACGKPLSL